MAFQSPLSLRYWASGNSFRLLTILCFLSFLTISVTADYRVHIVHSGYLQGEVFGVHNGDPPRQDDCFDKDSGANNVKCVGGCHRRVDHIELIRAADPDVITVDTGGFFWGSTFFTLYNTSASVTCFNAMKYDVAAFGGTDLYGTIGWAYDFISKTSQGIDTNLDRPPLVATNLDVSGNADWSQYIRSYYVHDSRDGYKVGFVSLLGKYFETTTSDLPTWFKINSRWEANNYVRRAIATMRKVHGDSLKAIVLMVEQNRDLTVIDSLLELEHVNVILVHRGQTLASHVTRNIYGQDVFVSVIASKSGYVSELDITISEPDGQITVTYPVISSDTKYTGTALTSPLSTSEGRKMWDDMQTYNPLNNEAFQRVILTLPTDADGTTSVVSGAEGERAKSCADKQVRKGFNPTTWGCRSAACPMGEVLVRALLNDCPRVLGRECDVAFINSGSIRASFSGPGVKVADVHRVLPFSNILTSFNITGKQLKLALGNSITESHSARFLQTNFRFAYFPILVRDRELKKASATDFATCGYKDLYGDDESSCNVKFMTSALERVMDVQVLRNGVWEEVVDTHIYKAVTTTYLYEGGDCYTELRSSTGVTDHGLTMQDALINYLDKVAPYVSTQPYMLPSLDALTGPEVFIEAPLALAAPASTQPVSLATNSVFRSLAEAASCLFVDDEWMLPPIDVASSCMNAFSEKTAEEYNRCPHDGAVCTKYANITFFTPNTCDAEEGECSGFGVCANKKCTCTFNLDTYDEVVEGVPTYGPFAGITMIRGTACSEIRTEWSLTDGERASMYIAGVIAICASLAWMGMLIYHRQKPIIKATSPLFSVIMCVGALIGSLGIFMDAQDATTDLCNASLWLILIGYVILFSSVFVKTHRIDHIFNSKLLKNKTKYTDTRVLINVAILLACEVIILVVFRVISPLEPVASALSGSFEYAMLCTSDDIIFTALLFVFNGLLMFWGIYLAFRTRNVDSNFNESKHIGVAIYNCAFSCLIMVLVMYVIVSTEPAIAYIIKAWIIAYVVVATLTIMFLPRFKLMFNGVERTSDTSSNKSSVGDLEKQAQRDKRTIQFLVQKMKERDNQIVERDEAINTLTDFLKAKALPVPALKVTPVQVSTSSAVEIPAPAANSNVTPSGAPRKPLFANRLNLNRNSVLSTQRPVLPSPVSTYNNSGFSQQSPTSTQHSFTDAPAPSMTTSTEGNVSATTTTSTATSATTTTPAADAAPSTGSEATAAPSAPVLAVDVVPVESSGLPPPLSPLILPTTSSSAPLLSSASNSSFPPSTTPASARAYNLHAVARPSITTSRSSVRDEGVIHVSFDGERDSDAEDEDKKKFSSPAVELGHLA